MKSFVFVAMLVAAVVAAPADDKQAQIVKQDFDNIGTGPYTHSVETSQGIQQQAQGQLKQVDADREAVQVTGSFSYTAPDGQVISLRYIADENGFRPEGDHLPK